MKLRSLSLQGFKSFPDRTELRFHDGITAIVGPNGCGKSNISDAIRWVLGEQRPSAIRGSRMDEAIFQGTVARRGLNRAEVGLRFDNQEGRLPIPHSEVEIRRIVFREGGSDYQLNRQSTRLRDILDLCRDTGLGANAYTVIEQGMVDSILSDRADDRRHMFEEAAGVGRYKDRRKAAQRKLEAAEADLTRLNDLVTEVEAKVRNLARQKRRAQKYVELRKRRLDLEVAVAMAELEEVRATLARTAERLDVVTRDEPAARAALSAAEAELERQRLESADAARMRNTVAVKLEEVSRRVAERERELAVAGERRSHAERRLIQIQAEREELAAKRASLEAELLALEAERTGQAGVVGSLKARVHDVQQRHTAVRRAVTDVRRADEDARARETELTRRLARLEAEAAAGDARAAEADARLEHLEAEWAELEAELDRLDEQGDLFAEQARLMAERLEDARAELAAAQAALADVRAAEAVARQALGQAEDEARRAASRVEALDAVIRDYQGFAPAVQAALAARDELTGLVGPVAEFLRLPADRAAAMEVALGSLLQALVIEDREAVGRLRAWLADGHADKGAVALLPMQAMPRLEALIEMLDFAGAAPSEPVLVGRREKLEALRREAAGATASVEVRRAERVEAAGRVEAAEARMHEAEAALHDAELGLRRAQADEATRAGQRSRAERTREELARRRAELVALGQQARDEAGAARDRRTALEQQLADHRTAWQAATESLADREAAWEAVRDEEAELRVAHARAEGALTALDRRIAGTREELERGGQRLAALEAEEAEHRRALSQLEAVRAGAGESLDALLAKRDALAAEVRTLDDRLADAAEAALGLEARVRDMRRTGDERSELRHRLELLRTEAAATERRVRERLEAEWGRPFEQIVEDAEPVTGDTEPLRAELLATAADIERLGPINMLAVEEHDEESRRLEFLQTQRDDLVKARDDLQSAIRQINRTAREMFTTTFESIRHNFQHTFRTLFEGGECDIRLEDPDDPLESPIEIAASPRGKRTQRIHLLSGGERALTALALLFAIYLVKPSPFCVLDEVDAPLDEANIGRFIAMLQQFKASTQFIVITHNPRTMEAADWLYGVTMQEPGISTVVGVRLDEVLANGDDSAAADAAVLEAGAAG
jgi:chromosome segregation protein